MFRFVLVLLFAGALWFGYGQLASKPAAPGDGRQAAADGVDDALPGEDEVAEVAFAVDREADVDPDPSSGRGAPAPALRAAPDQSAPQDGEAVADELIAGLAGGDPEATARAFSVLASQEGASRERVAQAIDAASKRAGAPSAVALLGTNNDFLHTDHGRRLAREAIEKAVRLPEERAVATLSQLMEVCMRGSIAKTDGEARALVDETWGALRRVLLKTVLNPADMARARSYKVAAGDVLDRIAQRFRELGYKVDAGTIAAFNRIDDPRRLRAGQVLKIPVEPIKTVVEKRSFLAAVYVGDIIFRVYWVGHGTDDRTPEATFTVGDKLKHPAWYAPDGQVWPYGHPQNVLGDYFVKFRHPSFTGFGAHGTSEPETIGTMASAGCLRMADPDIEDFFQLVPRGSVVEIRASH